MANNNHMEICNKFISFVESKSYKDVVYTLLDNSQKLTVEQIKEFIELTKTIGHIHHNIKIHIYNNREHLISTQVYNLIILKTMNIYNQMVDQFVKNGIIPTLIKFSYNTEESFITKFLKFFQNNPMKICNKFAKFVESKSYKNVVYTLIINSKQLTVKQYKEFNNLMKDIDDIYNVIVEGKDRGYQQLIPTLQYDVLIISMMKNYNSMVHQFVKNGIISNFTPFNYK